MGGLGATEEGVGGHQETWRRELDWPNDNDGDGDSDGDGDGDGDQSPHVPMFLTGSLEESIGGWDALSELTKSESAPGLMGTISPGSVGQAGPSPSRDPRVQMPRLSTPQRTIEKPRRNQHKDASGRQRRDSELTFLRAKGFHKQPTPHKASSRGTSSPSMMWSPISTPEPSGHQDSRRGAAMGLNLLAKGLPERKMLKKGVYSSVGASGM